MVNAGDACTIPLATLDGGHLSVWPVCGPCAAGRDWSPVSSWSGIVSLASSSVLSNGVATLGTTERRASVFGVRY
jgi:hypothetical protein